MLNHNLAKKAKQRLFTGSLQQLFWFKQTTADNIGLIFIFKEKANWYLSTLRFMS
jgi:hypothetical protein